MTTILILTGFATITGLALAAARKAERRRLAAAPRWVPCRK